MRQRKLVMKSTTGWISTTQRSQPIPVGKCWCSEVCFDLWLEEGSMELSLLLMDVSLLPIGITVEGVSMILVSEEVISISSFCWISSMSLSSSSWVMVTCLDWALEQSLLLSLLDDSEDDESTDVSGQRHWCRVSCIPSFFFLLRLCLTERNRTRRLVFN